MNFVWSTRFVYIESYIFFFIISGVILMLVREALVFDSNNRITPVGSRVNTLLNCCWISAFSLSVNLEEVPLELSSRNGAMLIFVFNFPRTYDQKTCIACCNLLTISFSNFHFALCIKLLTLFLAFV